MVVKTEKELSEAVRSHWLKAVAAIELRNFGYAISLLQGILKQEGRGCRDVRSVRQPRRPGLLSQDDQGNADDRADDGADH